MEIKYPTFRWAEPRSWAGKYSWRHVQPTLIVIVHVQYRNVIHGLVLSNYEQPFTEYTLQNSPHPPRRDRRPLKLCFENCPSHCSSAPRVSTSAVSQTQLELQTIHRFHNHGEGAY